MILNKDQFTHIYRMACDFYNLTMLTARIAPISGIRVFLTPNGITVEKTGTTGESYNSLDEFAQAYYNV